ncbi:MAG: response regulator, partial [Verrucomicrobia bacterium]
MAAKKITVLLADDHTIVRQGFRALLESEADIAVVGEAATGRQAVELTRKLQPDVV